MRTFEKVKGAPVFFGKHNRLLGTISDLAYSKSEGRITGYWIQNHRWWTKKHILPITNISKRTKKGFYIHGDANLLGLKQNEARFIHGKDRLIGRAIKQKDGDMIGIVEDVYFLPSSGRIVGYEMTEGLFEDLKQGIKVIKTGHYRVRKENEALVLTGL